MGSGAGLRVSGSGLKAQSDGLCRRGSEDSRSTSLRFSVLDSRVSDFEFRVSSSGCTVFVVSVLGFVF